MKTKLQNITNFLFRYSMIIVILLIWQIFAMTGILPEFLLPSPIQVVMAFVKDFGLIMHHFRYTMVSAFIGISVAILLAFVLSIIMNWSRSFYDFFYSPIVVSQTIPTVAIAPLLVIWLGYDMKPKIVLIVMTVFFPILISLLNGYQSVDKDCLKLLQTMGASKWQTYYHAKFPASVGYFFSGLRVSMSYALISSVIAEWLGGHFGLGVYMTRVRKAYAIDKMFAIIFFISILSLLLMAFVDYLHKKIVKYD